MSDDLKVTGTKSTASTAVFCSSFSPHMFFPEITLGLSKICSWSLAVAILTHALKFSCDRIWRLQWLNKKAGDRVLVRCPFPRSGTWPAQYNWERQVASHCFLFSLCMLTLFFTWKQFCTSYHVCHSAMYLFFFRYRLLFSFFFFFWGEGTRTALDNQEADAPGIRTVT